MHGSQRQARGADSLKNSHFSLHVLNNDDDNDESFEWHLIQMSNSMEMCHTLYCDRILRAWPRHFNLKYSFPVCLCHSALNTNGDKYKQQNAPCTCIRTKALSENAQRTRKRKRENGLTFIRLALKWNIHQQPDSYTS